MRWIARASGLLMALAACWPLVAQESTDSKLAALLPKARQLQHDGNLVSAEQVAQYDVDHGSLAERTGAFETLTSIYRQSGRFEQALEMGKRYQQLLESIHLAHATKLQDMHLMLAEILASLGKYPEAITHIDDALKISAGWRATDPLWEPHTFALRAQINQAAGNSDAADADWREVESRSETILNRLGQAGVNVDLEEGALKLATAALVSTDRTTKAIALREEFLAKQRDAEVRARNWSEIAYCYALVEQDAKEEQALREALALETKTEGLRGKAARADLLDRLGLVQKHRGDVAGAEAVWREAATIYQELIERYSGRRHRFAPELLYMTKLQADYERLKQWPAAIEIGQRLLDERSQVALPDDPKLWRTKGTLAVLYARTGDTGKSRQLLTEVLDYWRNRLPAANSDLAKTDVELSKVAQLKKDGKDAISFAEDAVKVWQEAGAGHELKLAEAYDNLADVLAGEKQFKRAVDTYRQAIEICRSRPKDRQATRLLCSSLVDLATLYKAQHEYHQAADYCAQALQVRQRSVEKDPLTLIGLYTALAALQLADQQTASGKRADSELAEAEANIAAARTLCHEQGWLDGAEGVQVLELEAVVDVRHQKLDAARKSLDEALAISRRGKLSALEAKIRTELAQLEQHSAPASAKPKAATGR